MGRWIYTMHADSLMAAFVSAVTMLSQALPLVDSASRSVILEGVLVATYEETAAILIPLFSGLSTLSFGLRIKIRSALNPNILEELRTLSPGKYQQLLDVFQVPFWLNLVAALVLVLLLFDLGQGLLFTAPFWGVVALACLMLWIGLWAILSAGLAAWSFFRLEDMASESLSLARDPRP